VKRLKAPFPYFGGKGAIAHRVWSMLGDVENYIEPFCGSAAVLLARPHPPRVETVNDIDCMIANFWRATQQAPERVAQHCNWPVNEADLHARHKYLVGVGRNRATKRIAEFRERMRSDPEFSDAKIAGWWAWGACCWIGGAWCIANQDGKAGRPGLRPELGKPRGLNQRTPTPAMPRLEGCQGGLGVGVHRKLDMPTAGRPQLADAYSRGRGVHGHDEAGTCAERLAWLVDWFGQLRDRLRAVRVCCGDWSRVCSSDSVTVRIGTTGVFLDPPYSAAAGRSTHLYASDDLDVAHQVRDWCLDRGRDCRMRIVLAGYEGEGHEPLEQAGWNVESWETQGGYANRNSENVNRKRERLWSSPACLSTATLWSP